MLIMIFFYTSAGAQVRNTDVNLTVIPQNPSPNEEVTATVSSYVADLNKSYIVWLINGKQTAQGIGKKSISFNAGELGTTLSITVNIEMVDGQSVSKNFSLNPSDVDIVWEAVDSYTPPFYRGKPLGPREGVFKVVAIPNIKIEGKIVKHTNLSYAWKKNGINQQSSGWGKSSFSFTNSFLDEENEIEVKVADIFGNTVGAGKSNISFTDPKIVFYQKDPVLGTQFAKSINPDVEIPKNGATIVAMPYFFSKEAFLKDTLSFRWFSGNQEVPDIRQPRNELNIRGEEGKNGEARVRLLLSNPKTLFQETERVINVIF